MRRENFITYTPSAQVKPVVSWGESQCQLTTLADAAAQYEAMGYRVAGAVNGDYYDTATGAPLGIQVSAGELLGGIGLFDGKVVR